MRDLYACIKKLSASAKNARRAGADEAAAVEFNIMRNFGGKGRELHRVLVSYNSQRMSAFDPLGLTQGMVEVFVTLRHEPNEWGAGGHLGLWNVELPEHSVARRGVIIEQLQHGQSCVLDAAAHPEAVDLQLRPCDLVLPGDVLVLVECLEDLDHAKILREAEQAEGSRLLDVDTRPLDIHHGMTDDDAKQRKLQAAQAGPPALPFDAEHVDTVYEASRVMRKLAKHRFRLKLLRRSECHGELERVGRALATLERQGSPPEVQSLVAAGLTTAEAVRACAQVAKLRERFEGKQTRLSWPGEFRRAGGLWTGWREQEEADARQAAARKAALLGGQERDRQELTARQEKERQRREAEEFKEAETKAQARARMRQEELAAKQAALMGRPPPAKSEVGGASASAEAELTAASGQEKGGVDSQLEKKEDEVADPYAPDVRVSLRGELVTEAQLLVCVERGEVADPLTGRLVTPASFMEGGHVDEVAYELARRRVGLPPRPACESLASPEDATTGKLVRPENFTRRARRNVTRPVWNGEYHRDGSEVLVPTLVVEEVLAPDGTPLEEHDEVAHERARRRVGLPWNLKVLSSEGYPTAHVAALGKPGSKGLLAARDEYELKLSRIVPGTERVRMSRLQQFTLYGPAGQPAPCCWKALYGRCARGDACKLCDHGALVPANWVSHARATMLGEDEEQRKKQTQEISGPARTQLGPPTWAFMADGFRFRVPTVELVRSNLADRSSRHLMLLTHNAVALQLLFDGGLLREHEVSERPQPRRVSATKGLGEALPSSEAPLKPLPLPSSEAPPKPPPPLIQSSSEAPPLPSSEAPPKPLPTPHLKPIRSPSFFALVASSPAVASPLDPRLLRAQVDVLFGSRFPEDISELQLVQQVCPLPCPSSPPSPRSPPHGPPSAAARHSQVNRVKMAMAKGRTIVLVNHDNIYEALYDVLNQRYLVKRDPATGETRRLLRLAIGSRSQLCVCHDDFKVVVIVEASHAHERLDLPLLNRFEKQEFTPAHALSEAQQRLCARLAEWAHAVAADLAPPASAPPTPLQRRRALAGIFCGWHDGLLASLAMQLLSGAESDEPAAAEDEAVDEADGVRMASAVASGQASPLPLSPAPHPPCPPSLLTLTLSVCERAGGPPAHRQAPRRLPLGKVTIRAAERDVL